MKCIYALPMKVILIISPEPWNYLNFLQLSKHHYARTLAEEGHRVYFLEPPTDTVKKPAIFSTSHPLINRICYPVPIFDRLRFHCRPLYDLLESFIVKKITLLIGEPLDIVWSFNPNIMCHLGKFRALKNVYHPVDPISRPCHGIPARSADIIISVSKPILSFFSDRAVSKLLLNHGVAPAFARLAESSEAWIRSKPALKVGYAGNMLMANLAEDVILLLVTTNPSVEFHFWGSVEADGETDSQTIKFLQELRSASNCFLHGSVSTESLARHLSDVDILLLAYRSDPRRRGFDFSNSHKIMEYLACGQVILSSPMSEHACHDDGIMVIAEDNSSKSFQDGFRYILHHLDHLNGPYLTKKRKSIALKNTYQNHWNTIETRLGEDNGQLTT
jgi:hypothetical protein